MREEGPYLISSETPFKRKVVRASLIFNVAINFLNENLLEQSCSYSRAWLRIVPAFKTERVLLTLQLVMKEIGCISGSSWQYSVSQRRACLG